MSHMIGEYDTCYCPESKDFPELAQAWHGLQCPPEGGGEIKSDGSNIPGVLYPIIEGKLEAKFDIQGDIKMTPEIMEDCDLSDYKLLAMDQRNGKAKGILPLHVPHC